MMNSRAIFIVLCLLASATSAFSAEQTGSASNHMSIVASDSTNGLIRIAIKTHSRTYQFVHIHLLRKVKDKTVLRIPIEIARTISIKLNRASFEVRPDAIHRDVIIATVRDKENNMSTLDLPLKPYIDEHRKGNTPNKSTAR